MAAPPGSSTATLDFVPCLFFDYSMAKDEEPIRPMTLGNMRQNGVRGLFVTCQHCGAGSRSLPSSRLGSGASQA
jgi:hypothetical protein